MPTLSETKYPKISFYDKSATCSIATMILTVLVVAGHVSRIFSIQGAYATNTELGNNSIFDYLTKFLYSFHMPAFIATSGATFYLVKCELNRYHDSKKFIVKKIIRLIIPYFFFLFVFVTPTLFFTGLLNVNSVWKLVLRNMMILGDDRHLWFLPMLFVCFCIIYFAFNIIRKRTIISTTIFIALNIASYYYPLQVPFINNTFHFLIYFYLGFLIMTHINRLTIIRNPIFILISLGMIIICCHISTPLTLLFLGILGTLAIFGISWSLASKKFTTTTKYQALKRNAYGIYLFHPMLIYIAYYFISFTASKPLIIAPLIFLSVLPISYLLTEAFRRFGAKIVIGEK